MKETVYSFSRLMTFEQCPLQYKYKYIDKLDNNTSNFFSELGNLGHTLLEAYDRDKIPANKLGVTFDKYVNKRVPTSPPFPIRSSWIKQTSEFFTKFQGFSTPALGIERNFVVDFGDFKLKGFIDRETSKAIIDYKISNPFKKKDVKTKRRQLYLYSKAYKDQYGHFPEKLYFYFFRKQEFIVFPFNEDEYNEAVEWARSVVRKIEAATEHPAKIDTGFCHNLCSFRDVCTAIN